MSPAAGGGVGDSTGDHVFITRCDPPAGSGLRLAVKDCIDVAGIITTAGSPAVAESAEPAGQDAACLLGARATGTRIVGKTNLHELCFGVTGVNPHFGTPKNPLDPTRIPGGSSSGSAVAVATGAADVALGTDTAGSVRNPAACCGVVGAKTTFGRIPVAGTRPLAPSMDTIGPLARDVAGVAAGLALLEPGFVVDVIDRGDEIRVGRFRGVDADPRIDAAVDGALERSGFGVVDVSLRGWNAAHENGRLLLFAEALEVNAALWHDHRDRLGVDVRERFALAEQITDAALASVRTARPGWQDELLGVLDRIDALVTVGHPRFPPRIDARENASNPAGVAVSFAGCCALVLPVPTAGGPPTTAGGSFPASLQLIGSPGSEERLLAVAALLEDSIRPIRPDGGCN